jgi:hypothetical protein
MDCKLLEIESRMTPWEAWTFSWYGENVSPFSQKMGIVADNFKALRLKGLGRTLFLKAMNMIQDAVEKVGDERQAKAAEEGAGR